MDLMTYISLGYETDTYDIAVGFVFVLAENYFKHMFEESKAENAPHVMVPHRPPDFFWPKEKSAWYGLVTLEWDTRRVNHATGRTRCLLKLPIAHCQPLTCWQGCGGKDCVRPVKSRKRIVQGGPSTSVG